MEYIFKKVIFNLSNITIGTISRNNYILGSFIMKDCYNIRKNMEQCIQFLSRINRVSLRRNNQGNFHNSEQEKSF